MSAQFDISRAKPVDEFLDILEAVEAWGAGRRENDVLEREQLVVAASRLLVVRSSAKPPRRPDRSASSMSRGRQ
jgi:hypothetical protein